MKNVRSNTISHDPTVSVWCQRCSIRIAPYDRRQVKNRKVYHEGCYSKMMNEGKRAGRN